MKFPMFFFALAMIFFGSSSPLEAQIYHHKATTNFLFGGGNFIPFIGYGGRLNLAEPNNESALSLNAEVGLDINFITGSRGSSLLLDFDVPVYLAYDVFGYSTWNSNSYFGGFVGFGLEYFSFPTTFPGPNSSAAPMVIGGFRFYLPDMNYELAGSYRFGNGSEPSFVGIRLGLLLGEY